LLGDQIPAAEDAEHAIAVVDTKVGTATARLDDAEAMRGNGSEDCAELLETGTGTT
jgi:hypothetical protein